MPHNPVPTAEQLSPVPPGRLAYSVLEVSRLTGLSASFVRLEIRRGNLRASKVGRRVIVLAEHMKKWLDRGTWLRSLDGTD